MIYSFFVTFCYYFVTRLVSCTQFVTIFVKNNKAKTNKMAAKIEKKTRKGTKKNNVTLREKPLSNDKKSLYLDVYRDGVRSYEFLKLYINEKARTPIEREANKNNLELAEKIRTERETELNYQEFGFVAPKKSSVLFFEYAQSYIDTYTKKDVRMVTGAVARFKSFLTDKRPHIKPNTLKLSQIDKFLIEGYVEYIEEKSTGEGAHGYFQRFKKVLKHAVDKNLILRSPADGIRCSTVDGLRKDILTNAEISTLAKTDCQNATIKKAFIFSCCTGLRFCDIKELQFKHIDFGNSKMTLDQQKTGKPVIIDLNPTALKILGTGKAQEFVFELPSFNGCNKTLKAWVKRAKIDKHITWHCARHSFAVNLLTSEQRPDIKTVSSTLGHSSLKHTEKYTRVVDELKKKAVNALPDYEL